LVETVALVVSLGALVVSCASLYISSLSPAEIEVDHVPRGNELQSGSFTGPHPQSRSLELAIFISNTGARGGLLEDLTVSDFRWLGRGEPYWIGVDRANLMPSGGGRFDSPPTALEAADVRTALLQVPLQPASGELEEQARRIGGMEKIEVAIRWTFVRTKGLPVHWRVLPERYRRNRERIERSTRVEVDATRYREQTLEWWKTLEGTEHLLELAGAGPA
jgi:hypothetical protein